MQPEIEVRRRKRLKEMASRKTLEGRELPVDDINKVKYGDYVAKKTMCAYILKYKIAPSRQKFIMLLCL